MIERSGNGITSKFFSASVSPAFLLVMVLGFVATQFSQAQTFSALYNFGGAADGGDPYAGVIRDSNGNFYGTVGYGGTAYAGGVYKVDSLGNETMLYSFTGGADGNFPISTLARDSAGNLYGTTAQGGSTGSGVVFKVDPSGNETVLHSFTGGSDGTDPSGGLLLDAAGNLYGTTSQGGTFNDGILFKLSPAGTETILHTFTGVDGKYPSYTNLVRDAQGGLYGVTQEGGSANHGVVYKLTHTGKFTVLYSFAGGTADGCNVLGTPLLDKSGNIYGTTSSCGASGFGTVWKLTSTGAETVLHSFAGGTADGEYPLAGVVEDANGNLYGSTETGGSANLGTVYRVSPTGQFKLLHSFTGPDGKYPYSGFILHNGDLYGTAQNGGSIGYGSVWKFGK